MRNRVRQMIAVTVVLFGILLFVAYNRDMKTCIFRGEAEESIDLEKIFLSGTLEWGMTQQEVLKALNLQESDVVLEEETLPEEEKYAPRTHIIMRCNKFSFREEKVNVIFTFVKKDTDPAWDIGVSRMKIEVCEDDSGIASAIQKAFRDSNLNVSVKPEKLTEEQKAILRQYCVASYPGMNGYLFEYDGIMSYDGIALGDEDKGVYYLVTVRAEFPAVWNRYVIANIIKKE